jgi:hypothetical protein
VHYSHIMSACTYLYFQWISRFRTPRAPHLTQDFLNARFRRAVGFPAKKVSRLRHRELHTPQPAGQSNGSIGHSAAAVFQAQLVYYVLQGLEVRKPTESSCRQRAMEAIENGVVAVRLSRIEAESRDLWQRNGSIRQLGSSSVSVDG